MPVLSEQEIRRAIWGFIAIIVGGPLWVLFLTLLPAAVSTAIQFLILFVVMFVFFLWVAALIEGEIEGKRPPRKERTDLRPTWQGIAILIFLVALSAFGAYGVMMAPHSECDRIAEYC